MCEFIPIERLSLNLSQLHLLSTTFLVNAWLSLLFTGSKSAWKVDSKWEASLPFDDVKFHKIDVEHALFRPM